MRILILLACLSISGCSVGPRIYNASNEDFPRCYCGKSDQNFGEVKLVPFGTYNSSEASK